MRLKHFSLFLLLSLLSSEFISAQMIILSGPEKASYHQFVDDMITVLEQDSIRAFSNVATNGAAYNFNELTDPNTPIKMAMMQSDYLYYMQMLDNKNNTTKTANIKVLMPLGNEEIHIVTREEDKLTSLEDLSKKRIACGTESQGTYATAILIKDKSRVFWNTEVLHFDKALKDLMGYKIDGFIMVGSAPLPGLQFNPQSVVTKVSLMNLENLNGWAEYYTPEVIKAGTYKWQANDVQTFSIKTVLVVNDSKLTAKDRELLALFTQTLKIKDTNLVEIGHPGWTEVNFSDWDPSNWPMFKN
jgi:TRAP transporter TAXI family solute receptor